MANLSKAGRLFLLPVEDSPTSPVVLAKRRWLFLGGGVVKSVLFPWWFGKESLFESRRLRWSRTFLEVSPLRESAIGMVRETELPAPEPEGEQREAL